MDLIPVTPRHAMEQAIGLIGRRERITIAALASGPAPVTAAGAAVLSAVQAQPYSCSVNADDLPPAVLAEICRTGPVLYRLWISGVPLVRDSNATRSIDGEAGSGDRQLNGTGLRALAAASGLSIVDLTDDYISRWTGHFPFAFNVWRLEGCADCLVVARQIMAPPDLPTSYLDTLIIYYSRRS